jgi:hypothetical protein
LRRNKLLVRVRTDPIGGQGGRAACPPPPKAWVSSLSMYQGITKYIVYTIYVRLKNESTYI